MVEDDDNSGAAPDVETDTKVGIAAAIPIIAQPPSALPTPPILQRTLQQQQQQQPQYREKDDKDQELIRRALRKSPFFTCLDEEQMERFVQVAELKRYVSGQNIILEGCVDDAEVPRVIVVDNPHHHHHQQVEDARITTAITTNEPPIAVSSIVLDTGAHSDDDASRIQTIIGSGSEENVEGFLLVEKGDGLPTSTSDDEQRQESAKHQGNTKPDNPSIQKQQQARDDPNNKLYLEPPSPPKSGVPRYIYIIRDGKADVLYSKNNVNPASLGTGTVFGEGGFLFGRQHSASVLAASNVLECYVVDAATFRNHVLPSENMTKIYNLYARQDDDSNDDNNNNKYMTMEDFVNSCLGQGMDGATTSKEETDPIQDPLASVRIANTFNILSRSNDDNNAQVGGGATAATTTTMFNTQRISLADFCLFHLLMARPDPEVDITFLLIDVHKRGVLYKDDIASFLKSSSSSDGFTFDMNSDFIRRHFGGSKGRGNTNTNTNNNNNNNEHHQRGIRPHQFSQFLVDLRREVGQQVFLQEVERNGKVEGYMAPSNFVKILKTACGWRLPDGVANRLGTIYLPTQSEEKLNENNPGGSTMDGSNWPQIVDDGDDKLQGSLVGFGAHAKDRRLGDHCFSYCDFLAYQEVLGQLPGICNLIDRACEIKKGPISPDDFKVANRVLGMGGSLSRRQVDIIFQLFDVDGDGYISHEDTVAVAGVELTQRIDAVPGRRGTLTFAPPPNYRHGAASEKEIAPASLVELLQNFSLTSVAGAIGVIALAPLDLVKTRLMNERIVINGKRMYQNSLHCLNLAFRSEGYLGLYRGLLPALIGVAPEKAIKLAVNDLVHQSFGAPPPGPNKTAIHFAQEMLAGGCAGACQLLVTNPIEIVKIRMQLQGETARLLKARGFENPVPHSLKNVVKTLGYSGMFTGARSTLLRDIPFGAIYFPTYSLIKESLSAQNGCYNSISAANLLLAGTLAGVPSSLLTTPADVIKTRLMAVPRPGEVPYDGIRDCFMKIYEREGPMAFFRGSAMRVAKISPQFGISLVAYEQLSQLLGTQGFFFSPTHVPVDPKDFFGAFVHQKTNDTDRLLDNLGSKSLRPSDPYS